MDSSWYVPLENAAAATKKSMFETSILEHFANLKLDDLPCEEVQTGFMCDIGNHNFDIPVIQRLIATGMTITRMKGRDINADVMGKIVQNIRKAVYNYSTDSMYVYPLAIILDVSGPGIVTGSIKNNEEADLRKGQLVTLTSDKRWKLSGSAKKLYVSYDNLTNLLQGDEIYIDSLNSEKVKLIVVEVRKSYIICKVDVSGLIGSGMTVHIVHAPREIVNDNLQSEPSDISNGGLLEHMNQQISWAIKADVDALLLSQTQFPSDILLVKEYLGQQGKHILVFASIDSENALRNIDEILSNADGIYLDRISLGSNFPLEKIFVAQKMVMAKCNYIGKPCICRVVINEKLPTLCVTDVANMIIDGADVLSVQIQYESLVNRFEHSETEKCMSAIAVVARHTERIIFQPLIHSSTALIKYCVGDPSIAICVSAVELSMRSLGVVIICMTNSGRTAKILSQLKPACPVIAVTRTCRTARQLRFWRGIRSIHYFSASLSVWEAEVEARVNTALDYCVVKHIIRMGDPYVVLSNSNKACGYCDSVKLKFATKANVTINDK